MRLPIPTALLLAAFLAAPAYAKTGESSESELEFARNGFYLGAGGVFLYPGDWDSDFESSFQGKASGIATTNAEAGARQLARHGPGSGDRSGEPQWHLPR